MSVARLQWANALRGVAAVVVMLGHLLLATTALQSWAEDTTGITAGRPIGDPAGLGALTQRSGVDLMGAGVCLFFLISGLVIARSLRSYSRRGFLVGRLLRLLPTYAAGYLVILAAVAAGAVLAGRPQRVDATDLVGIVPGLPLVLGLPAVPNPVAWTLIVEMAFYGICLVGYRRLVDSAGVRVAVAAGCVAVQALALHGPAWPSGARALLLVAVPFLPILLVGVHLNELDPAGPQLARRLLPVLPLLAASWWMTSQWVWWPFAPFGREGAGLQYQMTYLVTIAAFVVVWRWGATWFTGAWWRWPADISYPLYVVHLMVGWVLALTLIRFGWPTLPAELLAVVVVVGLAWVLHVVVEGPSHRYGRRLARRLSATEPAAPVPAQPISR